MSIGITGSGKSEGLRRDLNEVAESGEYSILFCDGKGSTAYSVLADLCSNGQEKRCEYDELRLRDGDPRMLRWRMIRPSTATDEHVRLAEDELIVERFLQAFYGVREMKTGTTTPYISLYATAAAFVMLGLPDLTINHMMDLFDRNETGGWMLRNTKYQRYAQEFLNADARSKKDQRQWEIETGGAKRLLKFATSPVVSKRSLGTFNWAEAIAQKKIILLNGQGTARETRRFAFTSAVNEATSASWDHYQRTGKPLPLLVVLEESGADDLVTPHVITMMQEARAAGVRVWLLSQSLKDFGDDDKFEKILGNVHRALFYRTITGVDRLAQILAYPTWDSHKVHHSREISYTDHYQEVPTQSISIDDKGRERVTHGVAYRPVQGIRIEETFETPQQHEAEFRQTILHTEFNIKLKDLQKEIAEFIAKIRPPTHIAEQLDAVRVVGNFAAHPLKATATGEIQDVEPGEAEWLIATLDTLFDFAFVQPAKSAAMKAALNAKLVAAGKPQIS